MHKQTFIYALAQAISFSVAVTSVSISAIVGSTLATSNTLATLPYAFQVFAVIVCSYFFSILMAKIGRQKVFIFGCACLALGGLFGGYSIIWKLFWLNCLAHWLIGMAAATFMYFRFAATDGLVAKHEKSRALSMVTFASIGAAFIGPFLADQTRLLLPLYAFSATYFSFILIATMLIPLLLISKNKTLHPTEQKQQSNPQKEKTPKRLWLAALTAGSGFLVMTLIMLQGSLLLQQDIWCGMVLTYSHISSAIQWHVVAMFTPSLFMPQLIERFGIRYVLFTGYLVLLLSIILGITSQQYHVVVVALVLLGIGWNILYVGGSVLITRLPGNASRWQGINETCMATAQTVSALSAGLLFYSIGWQMTQYLALALLLPGLICLLILWQRLDRNDNKMTTATTLP